MGNTVSNQSRHVATKGTTHIAKTAGPTDVCIDPSTGATSGFDNEVASTLLQPGTAVTLIANQKIWTAPHQLGPPSKNPHPPFIVGTVSGTHIMEAKATTYSGDVFAEGNGVVRTFDQTTQNHGNTPGYVDAGANSGAATSVEDLFNKQCTLVSLEGINEADGSAPDGLSVGTPAKVSRPLGYPGPKENKPPYYLEIMSGSKVTFKSVRKDVTVPEQTNPTCWKGGLHTMWLATRTGLGATTSKPETGKEEFIVDEALTGCLFDTVDGIIKAAGGLDPKIKNLNTAEVEGPGGNISGTNARASSKVSTSFTGTISSFEAVFAFFLYRSNPPFIDVQALSCGGSMSAKLKIFPSQKVDYTLDLSVSANVTNQTESQYAGATQQPSTMQKVKNAIQAIQQAKITLGKLKDISEYVKKIASLARQQFSVDFLVATSINFKVAYKPCTEDKQGFYGNFYTTSHVGLTWALTFTSSCLIGFTITFNISLINLVAPGLGEGAATALRAAGVRVDLVFSASISVPISFSIGQDEFDYPSATGVEIGINPELSLSIAVGFVIDLVRFGVRFPMSLKAGFFLGDKPKVLLQFQPKGELKTVLFLIVLEGSWFERKWEHEPENWKINWNGPKLDVITVS